VRRVALALACVAACDRRAPIASCADDLTGDYARGDRHWMILDRGATLEAYPLFPDVPAADDLEVAPRIVELGRSHGQLAGEVRRRYMKGSVACTAKVPARITSCTNDALELELADPSPPLAFAPCRWPPAEPSRPETWLRR
jgi:hypothetical protein